jgi:hypothetical protein
MRITSMDHGPHPDPLPKGEGANRPNRNPLPKGEGVGRREVIRTTVRYAAMAGLGAISAVLLWRRADGQAAGCDAPDACRGCAALARCRQPQAVQTRNEIEG